MSELVFVCFLFGFFFGFFFLVFKKKSAQRGEEVKGRENISFEVFSGRKGEY